jgi:hypothetical protein
MAMRAIHASVVWAICLLFTACHSGGDGGSGAGSSNNSGSAPPPNTSACAANAPLPSSFTLALRFASEIEPNDGMSTATVVTLPTPVQTGDGVGAVMMGRVNDSADVLDIFSFAAPRSRTFFFKLCESSCNTAAGNDSNGNPDSLDVSIAYFRVRDGSGNVLATTQASAPTQNYFELCVAGGVITYVEVVANSTRNASQNYSISAMERP